MIETKFKQTELCQIPEDWDIGTFADFLITFSAGATPYRGILITLLVQSHGFQAES